MTTSDDSLPPEALDELERRYDLIRRLGRGGMGAVWLARERSLDRLVAIKLLAGELVERSDLRERFRREARIAARLAHPNIVPLHAFGETADALYFVMGYVEGETLAARLERDGRIGRSTAVRILGEIAGALAFAHREGVVHRDVKPDNILLDARSGRAMLADFGIARIASGAGAATSVTMTGLAIGTPNYMAPEQALGARDVDGRADLYALGVVGYRMLSGRLPFNAGSTQLVLAMHTAAPPDDLTIMVAPEARAVAAIVMRALAKEPGDRWPSAGDFADELRVANERGVDVPEHLERLDMVGTKLLAATVAVITIGFATIMLDPHFVRSAGLFPLEASIALFPIAAAAAALPAARRYGWRDTARAMLHPPRSWSQWWPRALRRPDDLWDRLPAAVRRARAVIGGIGVWLTLDFVIGMPLAIRFGFADWVAHDRGLLGAALFVVPRVLEFTWIASEIARTKRLTGLSLRDTLDLLGLSNSRANPAWAKPKFARLLASEDARETLVVSPREPSELAQAIGSLSDRLRRAGFLDSDEGAVAAVAICDAIASLEGDVQRLRADLDPAEAERIRRRLATLDASADAELRALLENQQHLRERLEERCREIERRRDRLHDQLRTLWLQMVELDSRVSRGTPLDTDLTGRVRALSHDLARASAALWEVERFTAPPAELASPAPTPT